MAAMELAAEQKAKDFAQDRIAALLDGSDDDDQDVQDWSPTRIGHMFSSSQEKPVGASSADADIDLNGDDDIPIAIPSSPRAAEAATESADDGTSAYVRMKTLFSKPKPKSREPSPAVSVASHREMASPNKSLVSGESSEEEMPVKKVIRRPKRVSTPPSAQSSSPLPQRARSASPGLFVSPALSRHASTSPRAQISIVDAGSDSDEMPTTLTISNAKLQALVAQKRAEREAKESAERAKKDAARKAEAEKQKKLAKQYRKIYSSEMDDGMTAEERDKLVENSRPTQRKASKRALEEMNRETQRLARNMQLQHQARVVRKFSTADFVKGFFELDGLKKPESKAHNSSDTEGNAPKSTPPSSPPSLKGSQKQSAEDEDEYIIRTGSAAEVDDEEPPNVQSMPSHPPRFEHKGKAKAIPSSPPSAESKGKQTRKQIRSSWAPTKIDLDSDDDLELVDAPKPSRFAVFDEIKGKKTGSKADLAYRALANMHSPPSKTSRPGQHKLGKTHAQLQRELALKMQQQLLAHRAEWIRDHPDQVAEQQMMEEAALSAAEMIEKAKREAMALGLKEKERAEKNGEDYDETYELPSSDESEVGGSEEEEEEEEEEDIAASGSEEEDGEEDDGKERTGMFDDAAEEADDDEELDPLEDLHEYSMAELPVEVQPEMDADEDDMPQPQKARNARRNRNLVLDEDDDEKIESSTIVPEVAPTPIVRTRTSTYTSPVNEAFGFAMPPMDMNLTQMFKGTMEKSQTQANATPARQSLDFLRDAPAPTFLAPSPDVHPANLIIPSSQALETPIKPRLDVLTTPQFPTPAVIGSQMSPTRLSEIPEPTQDAGFDCFALPAERGGTQTFSTIETVMIPVAESPVIPKKNKKLRRRAQHVAELSDGESPLAHDPAAAEDEDEPDFSVPNAFDALFKTSKKVAEKAAFDKKQSKAKGMFEEQAEESEDEYAGLGGASDDESGSEDEEVNQMIDHGDVDVKEAELAAHFAERDREDNEKGVEKLYKDITTGALRKRRGAMGGTLSDDEDEDEEIEERRRRKREEFRKMRKALLLDENVGKLADNVKKQAFLKAIEDRDEDDGMDWLADEIESFAELRQTQTEESQGSGEQLPEIPGEDKSLTTQAPTTATTSVNAGVKRTLQEAFAVSSKAGAVPDMSHRRAPARPANGLGEKATDQDHVKRFISDLLEDPHSLIPDSQIVEFSDDETDEGPTRRVRQKRNDEDGSAVLTTMRASVINRLTISRQSSLVQDDESPSGPQAFHATSSTNGGFKIPSLLRRATTNLSTTSNSASSSGTTTPTTNENASVRMGGSKKSNIHFQAREAERMKKVREAEVRRKEGLRKSVVGKGRRSVLGRAVMGGGSASGFE